MARPKRQNYPDRIIHSAGSTPGQIQCDMATGPFDKISRDMDRKWGIDRLPELVSPATAAKWGLAMSQLNEAIGAEDVSLTVARVEACVRGFGIMDAEAIAAGHVQADPAVWEYELDGHSFGIIEDGRQWPAARADRPGLTIYTMREVAIALAAHSKVVASVKANFPHAEIVRMTEPQTQLEKDIDDVIPF
jgi:hypothetical protein